MQNMKNVTKKLNTLARQRRRTHKLSEVGAARQPYKIGLNGINELSAAARHACAELYLHADQEVLNFNQLINDSTFIWHSLKTLLIGA